MEITRAEPKDDPVLVRHYLALWDSYGVPREKFAEDAEERVRTFIQEGRASRRLAAFIAWQDGGPVGSAACQLHLSPYPEVLRPESRKFGYLWSVFVEEPHRGQGIAKRLVERALEHLREIGCTTAVLHASDAGEPLYAKLGFRLAKEMRLPFDADAIDCVAGNFIWHFAATSFGTACGPE